MHYETLHDYQENLDEQVNERMGLSGEDVMEERLTALYVEIGELANETRCFKFWSTKAPSDKEVVLEEFVDCMHFLLSIGNYSGYRLPADSKAVKIEENIKGSLTQLFLGFYHSVGDFQNHTIPANYVRMWDYFLSIANQLGFTHAEIFEAYIKKNHINIQRQYEGY